MTIVFSAMLSFVPLEALSSLTKKVSEKLSFTVGVFESIRDVHDSQFPDRGPHVAETNKPPLQSKEIPAGAPLIGSSSQHHL
jgi:hypothetical protein